MAAPEGNYRVTVTLGDPSAAEPLWRQCAEVAAEIGERRVVAYALHSLGRAEAARRGAEPARRHLEESLALFRGVRDLWKAAQVLVDLADLDRRAGNVSAARAAYEESLAAARELEDRALIHMALARLSELDRSDGAVTLPVQGMQAEAIGTGTFG